MKIRTDFVTNSSSSSFILSIMFELKDGPQVVFKANGGTPETGLIDYFYQEAIVTVSPKQLAAAPDIESMIQMLQDGVYDGDWGDPRYVFKEDLPIESEWNGEINNAYDFITEIRENIPSMDSIKGISIVGEENGYDYYFRQYSYNRETKEYYGFIDGEPLYDLDGSHGGDLRMSDEDECKIEYDAEADAW